MEGTIKSLRDFAETVIDLKKAERSASDIQTACCAGSVLLLRCREQSRQAALDAEHIKEQTSQQRAQLDHNSLQLHNLVYEQQYYDKEIGSCRTFKPGVPDQQLCCISPEDFVQQAGPAAAAAVHSAHDRELARLTYELQQRKQLKAHLQQLQQQKQQALTGLNAATGRIDDLRTHMEAISHSSRPLMETSLPETSTIKNNKEAAELLPLPLYIIYSQAVTGSSVVGLPVKVEIDGSTAAAARFAAEPSAVHEGAAAAAQAAKRRRKSDHHEDLTYKVHPLSVTIDVYSAAKGSPEPVMQLTFQYYTQLKLVGVSASTPEDDDVLTDLFLGDAGDGQLLENVAASSSGGTYQVWGTGRPRPFKWAQDLAGVDVVASLPSSYTGADRNQVLSLLSAYRSQLRLEAFVERLTAAKQGRLALKSILEKLSKKEQPHCSWEGKVLSKVNGFIYSWRHLSDAGMPSKQIEQLGAPSRPSSAAITRHAVTQVWQPAQQGSVQEEGEVAGAVGDGMEMSSRLQHGDTAEEDLLQGLLADEAGAVGAAAAAATVKVAGGDVGNMLEEGIVLNEDYAEAYEQGFDEGVYQEPSDAAEASGAFDGVPADDGVSVEATSSTPAMFARFSLHRLVLRSGNVEAHFHVKVFLNYPLCPPVFLVTKLLDITRSSSKQPAHIIAVNEVLRLEQQANAQAVQTAAGADPCEVLAVQVLQLRQCLDMLASQLRIDASKDLVDKLKAKQQLRGRERQARLMLSNYS